MEPVNPLEKLNILEKKVAHLIELLKAEREQNTKLTKENEDLKAKLESVENSLLKGTQNLEEVNQERMLTKMVVDELISSIDRSVNVEQEEL